MAADDDGYSVSEQVFSRSEVHDVVESLNQVNVARRVLHIEYAATVHLAGVELAVG